jgi:hypothetical protein
MLIYFHFRSDLFTSCYLRTENTRTNGTGVLTEQSNEQDMIGTWHLPLAKFDVYKYLTAGKVNRDVYSAVAEDNCVKCNCHTLAQLQVHWGLVENIPPKVD